MSRTADVLSFLAATRGQYVPVRSTKTSLFLKVPEKVLTPRAEAFVEISTLSREVQTSPSCLLRLA